MKRRNLTIAGMLLWAGCGTQEAMVPPPESPTPEVAEEVPEAAHHLLTLDELDGPWTFVPDIIGFNSQCFTFQSGTMTSFSDSCDGIDDLVASAQARIEDDEFSLAFSYTIGDIFDGSLLQVSASLDGAAIDENTIRVTETANIAGSPLALVLTGRLVRG